jgi:hypothetical protein
MLQTICNFSNNAFFRVGFLRMRGHFSALVTAAFMLFGCSSLHAQENSVTRIQIDWQEVMDRVSPAPESNIHVSRRISLVLKGGNQVDQDFSSTAGRYQQNSSKAMTLGGGVWYVGSTNTLVRQDDYPHHVRTISVRVSGKGCTASVAFRLKPGYRDYHTEMLSRPGETGTYSRLTSSYSRCSIM